MAQAHASSLGHDAVKPLYHYFNERLSDSYYTTDFELLRTGVREWSYKGIEAFVYANEAAGTVPLYEFWSIKSGDHMLSTDKNSPKGYQFKGIAAYVASKHANGTLPLYSYINNAIGDTLVTVNQASVPAGYGLVGTLGYVFSSKFDSSTAGDAAPQTMTHAPKSVPLYRYHNTKAADHLYTANWEELGSAVDNDDYSYEGITALVSESWQPGTVPLYRYWNMRTLDTFLTIDKSSVEPKSASVDDDNNGWKFQAIEGFVYPFRADGTVPLFRYYSEATNDHFYTTNSADLGFGKLGYTFQGVSAFVIPAPPALKDNLPPPTTTYAPAALYQYRKAATQDTFYSTRPSLDKDSMKGWTAGGAVASIYTTQVPDSVPLYRAYNSARKDHIYYIKQFPSGKDGYVAEGIEGYVRATPKAGWVALYRFGAVDHGEHVLTTDATQFKSQSDKTYKMAGEDTRWAYYGILCYVLPATVPRPNELKTVFESYNSDKHQYEYSTTKTELTGFELRGSRFWVLATQAKDSVPLFVYRNAEYNDVILTTRNFEDKSNGWTKDDKALGYVYQESRAGTVPVTMVFSDRVFSHKYVTNPAALTRGTQGLVVDGISGWQNYGEQFHAYASNHAAPQQE